MVRKDKWKKNVKEGILVERKLDNLNDNENFIGS